MKRIISFRSAILLCLVSLLLLSAAAPFRPAAEDTTPAKPDLVRLTIENKTTKLITIRLDGPAIYFLRVKGETTGVFTVNRGEYSATITACGVTGKEPLDLTTQKTLIMPVCGGSANTSATREGSAIDISKPVKVVKFTISNQSDTKLLAILTGPASYVFTLKKGESKNYTIAKGDYSVTYYACGTKGVKKFESYSGSKLELSCPKH